MTDYPYLDSMSHEVTFEEVATETLHCPWIPEGRTFVVKNKGGYTIGSVSQRLMTDGTTIYVFLPRYERMFFTSRQIREIADFIDGVEG